MVCFAAMASKEDVARDMLRLHGEWAAMEVGFEADAALRRGDLELQAYWKEIRRIILRLQGPDEGKAKH